MRSIDSLRDELRRQHPGDEFETYITQRWHYQVVSAHLMSMYSRNWVYATRLTIIIASTLLPVVVSLQASSTRPAALWAVLSVLLSLAVALSSGVQQVTRVHERWRIYGRLRDKLETIAWSSPSKRLANFEEFREQVELYVGIAREQYREEVLNLDPLEPPTRLQQQERLQQQQQQQQGD